MATVPAPAPRRVGEPHRPQVIRDVEDAGVSEGAEPSDLTTLTDSINTLSTAVEEKLAPADLGSEFTTVDGEVRVRPAQLPQEAARLAGNVGVARVGVARKIDACIGNSLAWGVGATNPGLDTWWTVMVREEARSLGLADPGPGFIPFSDQGAYGEITWSSLSTSTQVNGSGLLNGRRLTTPGQTIADVATQSGIITNFHVARPSRRIWVWYARETNGADIEISVNGGSSWSAPVDTTGSGVDHWDSGDLGSRADREVRVRHAGVEGEGVTIHGWEPITTDGATGISFHNMAQGGSSSGDYVSYRGWEAHLAHAEEEGLLRRFYILVGTRDGFDGNPPSTLAANLTLIVQRAKAAAPSAEIVVIGDFHASKPTAGTTNVSEEDWATEWIPAMEGVALAQGVTFLDMYERFGSVAEGNDPLKLTVDQGLHLGSTGIGGWGLGGQQAQAEWVLERLGRPRAMPRFSLESDVTTLSSALTSGLATKASLSVGSGITFTTTSGDRIVIGQDPTFGRGWINVYQGAEAQPRASLWLGTFWLSADGVAAAAQATLGNWQPAGVNAQTGTSYTFVLADKEKTITASNASPVAFTIPTNTSVAYPIGTRLYLINVGAGTLTVQGTTGVTVNGTAQGSTTIAQHASKIATKLATNTWNVS